MKVRAKSNFYLAGLIQTIRRGAVYKVIEEVDGSYIINNDLDFEKYYPIECFEIYENKYIKMFNNFIKKLKGY